MLDVEITPEVTRSTKSRFNARPTILAVLALCAVFLPRIAGWPFAVAALVLVLLDVSRVPGNRDRLGELAAAVVTVGTPTVLIAWWSRALWFQRTDPGANIGGELLLIFGYLLLPVGTLIQMGASRVDPPARGWRSLVAFLALCVAVSVAAVLVPQR
jgi:hypothetical protein